MTSAERELKILLKLQADATAAGQVTAALKSVEAQAAKTTAAVNAATTGGGSTQVSAIQATSAQYQAAITVSKEQQLIIEQQLQRVAALRFELVAAEVGGDKARAAVLREELLIRNATTQALRVNVFTQAELNQALAAQNILLATSAAKAEAMAVPTLFAGANLNKAASSAAALSQALNTGNITASSFRTVLGSLGTSLTIAGLASYELYHFIVQAGEAALETAKNNEKIATELHNAVEEWAQMAAAAQDFGDQLKLGDKIKTELSRLAVETAGFRAKELEGWQKLFDLVININKQIAKAYVSISSFGLLKMPDNFGPSTYGADLDKQKAEAQERYNHAVLDANLLIDQAKRSTTEWAAAEKNLPQGLADYTAKLSAAEAKLTQLDARRRENMQDPAALKAYQEQAALVEDLRGKTNQLGDELDQNNRKNKQHVGTSRELVNLKREESALMKDIRLQAQLIAESPFLTPEAKLRATHDLLLQEREEIIKTLEAWKAYQAAQKGGDPQTLANIQEAINKIRELQGALTRNQYALSTTTMLGDFRKGLADWVNAWGTTTQQISGYITTGINAGLQELNHYLVTGQGNVKQLGIHLAELGLQMLEQMALQQAAAMLGITTTTTAQVASGAAITTAHAPAAAATSISTQGASAIIGEIAAIAAIIAIMAALSGAFAGGGRLPGPASRRDNLLIAAAAGETIINAPASQQFDRHFGGTDWVAAMNTGRIPVAAGLASGGRVGSSTIGNRQYSQSGVGPIGNPEPPQVHVAYFDDRKKMSRWFRGREGQKIIVDASTRRQVL